MFVRIGMFVGIIGLFMLLVKHICPSALTCTGLRSGDRSRDRLYINV